MGIIWTESLGFGLRRGPLGSLGGALVGKMEESSGVGQLEGFAWRGSAGGWHLEAVLWRGSTNQGPLRVN